MSSLHIGINTSLTKTSLLILTFSGTKLNLGGRLPLRTKFLAVNLSALSLWLSRVLALFLAGRFFPGLFFFGIDDVIDCHRAN